VRAFAPTTRTTWRRRRRRRRRRWRHLEREDSFFLLGSRVLEDCKGRLGSRVNRKVKGKEEKEEEEGGGREAGKALRT
jgi:hypothetical protein